jgi:hypothetical protein
MTSPLCLSSRMKWWSHDRAAFLQKLEFGVFDALHLAGAGQGQADLFLTTDDKLLCRARRYSYELRISVRSPVSWYQEVAT